MAWRSDSKLTVGAASGVAPDRSFKLAPAQKVFPRLVTTTARTAGSAFAAVSASVLVAPLALLARHHRVMLVAIRDRVFERLAVRPGRDPNRRGLGAPSAGSERRIYQRLVIDDLLREREETLARLRQRGLHTLDLAPAQITASVLNSYLALRYG